MTCAGILPPSAYERVILGAATVAEDSHHLVHGRAAGDRSSFADLAAVNDGLTMHMYSNAVIQQLRRAYPPSSPLHLDARTFPVASRSPGLAWLRSAAIAHHPIRHVLIPV